MLKDQESLREGLASLAHFFIGDATLVETLQHVADLAERAVGPADIVGITMLVDGRPTTAVYTDADTPDIDTAQYDTGIGPCLDAFRDRQIYLIDDTSEDRHWEVFSAKAASYGICSTLSMPLVANGEGVGALNLYSRTGPFAAGDTDVAGAFAAQAGIVLANSQAYWDARHLHEDLAQAMQYRATIEQAKGILMATGGRSPDDAFQILVRASQRENRKLRELAAEIVLRVQQRQPG